MARLTTFVLAALHIVNSANGLVIPRTQDDIDRLRLAGQPELDIVHSLPITALSPSFHPPPDAIRGRRTSHTLNTEDSEAFHLPPYQHPLITNHEVEVKRSRMLRRILDRWPLTGTWFYRPAHRERRIPPSHGWLRNVLETITGSGPVDQADADELEYIEYATKGSNPDRPLWLAVP